MGEHEVVAWISYHAAEQKTESIGGLGGWFGVGGADTWEDYLARVDPGVRSYAEAIRDDVLRTGRFRCGNEHQDDDDGVPMFEDGTVGLFSYRAWGDLMAAIATLKDGQRHRYMDFYYA